MTFTKTHLFCFLAGLIVGLLVGFFTAKGFYDRPIKEEIKRDTVTLHDTVPDYNPAPKDSALLKYQVMWFPVFKHTTDTVLDTEYYAVHDTITDSVAVEIPITSKHYGDSTYDAWVSGYDPRLDSILVYQKTQYITTTITKEKQRSKWSIGVQAGYGYGFRSKLLEPYAGIGLSYSF